MLFIKYISDSYTALGASLLLTGFLIFWHFVKIYSFLLRC